jgi:transposase InsO family protein
MATNLVKIVRVDSTTPAATAMHIENTWLSCYPHPQTVTYDQHGAFIGPHFQSLRARLKIGMHCITSKNLQANSICERMHQTVANTLRAMSKMNPPAGVKEANQMIDNALANCMYATRSAMHGLLNNSPGSLAFQQDMILDIPVIADWEFFAQNCQMLVDQRLVDANR